MQNSKLSTRVLSTRVPYDYYIKIVGLAKESKMTVSDYVALIIFNRSTETNADSDHLLQLISNLKDEIASVRIDNDYLRGQLYGKR
jgi:macrodomain Ter protein organizer (MatP/YcbG family)